MIGLVSGRLTVVASLGGKRWLCRCECGALTKAYQSSLTGARHRKKSCGCLIADVAAKMGRATRTHGESSHAGRETTEHKIWAGMRQRCLNPNGREYAYYGGRGIGIDPRWDSYESFLADMGRRPGPEFSLDRIDNNDDYGPYNCRWATDSEQNRNRRCARVLEWRGRTKLLIEWAEEIGINPVTLKGRLREGWDIEKAMTTPARPYRTRQP